MFLKQNKTFLVLFFPSRNVMFRILLRSSKLTVNAVQWSATRSSTVLVKNVNASPGTTTSRMDVIATRFAPLNITLPPMLSTMTMPVVPMPTVSIASFASFASSTSVNSMEKRNNVDADGSSSTNPFCAVLALAGCLTLASGIGDTEFAHTAKAKKKKSIAKNIGPYKKYNKPKFLNQGKTTGTWIKKNFVPILKQLKKRKTQTTKKNILKAYKFKTINGVPKKIALTWIIEAALKLNTKYGMTRKGKKIVLIKQ